MSGKNLPPLPPSNQNRNLLKKSGGQVVLEYVLLLSIAVALAITIVKTLIRRDQSNPGSFISKWCELEKLIENDSASVRTAPTVTQGCN